MTKRHSRWVAGATRLAGAVAMAALAGCAGILPGNDGISVRQTGSNVQAPAVPAGTEPDDEVIGRREHPRIIAAFGGVYSDRKAEIMLAHIVGRLMTASGQADAKVTVTILDSPDVNAFALPGGYIYVTRGILALANDSSELAAVLAHELSHVILKHAQARSNRQHTTEIVDRVITSILGGSAETDQSAQRSRLSMAAFSQAQELAADKEGIKIAARAGYDPGAAARFLGAMGRFASFAAGQDSQGDDFLSSHPSTPERIEKALEIARAFDGANAERGRQDYLEAIDGLNFGDNPSQGAVVGHRFVHPQLGFTFTVPQRYQLQNDRNAVVGIAGDGEAVRFDTAEVPANMALTDYLKSGWIGGLDPATVKSGSVNGIDMATGEAETEQWTFRVSVVRFKGEVYRFIFAARSANTAFLSAAEQTVQSFRAATDADLKQIKKTTVQVVTAKAGDTTQSLAARMGNVGRPGDLFLILNNLYPGDPIAPGDQYKIVTIE